MELYLNVIKIKAHDLSNVKVTFYNSVPMKRNNLFQNLYEKECWIHNPQLTEKPLIITISKNEILLGATELHIKDYIPSILKDINV